MASDPKAEPDLSGYEIEMLHTGLMGWGWKVKTPDGGRLGSGLNFFGGRAAAEKHALAAIELHWRRTHVPAESMTLTGTELRDRVRGA